MNNFVLNTIKNLFCIWLVFPCVGSAQSYEYRNYFQQAELPQPYVYTINQDAQGFLWLGTGNGLTRFDGETFKTYTTSDSLAGNFISASVREKNTLWFGHMNGSLTSSNDGTFRKIITPYKNESSVTALCYQNEKLWVGYHNGSIITIKDNVIIDSMVLFENSDEPSAINSFTFPLPDKVLLGTGNGLYYFKHTEKDRRKKLTPIKGIPGDVQKIVTLKQASKYLIATKNNGIYLLNVNAPALQIKRIDTDYKEDLNNIQDILITAENYLYISTMGQGLFQAILDSSGVIRQINRFKDSALTTNYVKTSFIDREGILWVGTYGKGLCRITTTPFSFIPIQLPEDNQIHSLTKDSATFYLGTKYGLYTYSRKEPILKKSKAHNLGLPEADITSLFKTDSGLWIGTATKGLYFLNTLHATLKRQSLGQGNLQNAINKINADTNTTWIGTKKGLYNLQKNKWYTISKGGLPNNWVVDILNATDGSVWVATKGNTLSRIYNDSIQNVTIPLIANNFTIRALTQDSDNKIWVSTLGGGIYILDNKELKHLSTNENLLSDFCYAITADPFNNVWVGHKKGISQIINHNQHIKPITKFPGKEDLNEFGTHVVYIDEKNEIWFGLNEGLLHMNAQEVKANAIAPIINITSISVNGKEIENRGKLVFSPGTYNIQISYKGLSLLTPERIQYTSHLKGYNDRGITTNQTSITYPGLSSGRYVFTLSAKNSDGIESKHPISLAIVIRKSLWKRPSFYLTLLFIAFIFIIWRAGNIKKRLEHEKTILERKVMERTLEIEKQKEQLYQQNKKLLDSEKNLIQANASKDKFFSIIAHDLKNPLSSMLGLSELLEAKFEDLEKERQKKYIHLILQSGKNLYSLLTNLLEWSRVQTGRIAFNPKRFYLYDVIMPVINLLETSTLKKNITIYNKLDNKAIVFGDISMISTVIRNLISNAIKFTPENGEIHITSTYTENWTKISVTDSGVGMTTEDQKKLFRIDTSFSKPGTSGEQGTGLGLTLCKEFIEKHQGNLGVNSKLGEGAEFWFTLPVHESL